MSLATFDTLPDAERSLWLARWQRKQDMCDRHGVPKSVCHDPERTWFPARVVDYMAMEADAAQRAYQKLHEAKPYHDGTFTDWAEHRSSSKPYHYSDGVTIFAAPFDFSPGDDFTTDIAAQPANVFEQKGGEE